LLFVGEAVRFDTLKMTNLRDGAAPTVTVQAQVFRCPVAVRRCRPVPATSWPSAVPVAAPWSTPPTGITRCCRAPGKEREQYVPRLPLGSKGVLEDKPVEVIGFLVRRCKVDGIAYLARVPAGR
jgi:hypothetical protein